jgi:MFS family permease
MEGRTAERTGLAVLGVSFTLSVLGRGLGESFTVFLLPISQSFGWDRGDVVSIYSLTALCGGLASPLIGRLFDRSGPRAVFALGMTLLGGALLAASYAQQLWQFQLSVGVSVGFGIACIGNVPNSILLGRWFGKRLPTAMAVVYSATGAGVLIMLPIAQILIDRFGWRGAYQGFGSVVLLLLLPLLVLPWRRFATGSEHLARAEAHDLVDEGWTLLGAMRHHAFWALFCTFFFTAIGMYAISPQVVAYLIDAGFPPLQAATAWGFSGVVLLFGMLGVSWLDGIIGRRPSVLFSYALRQHDRLARSASDRDGDEDLSRRAGRHHLRHHYHRQRAGIGVRVVERRRDPRLDPQLQPADHVFACQCLVGNDPIPGRPGAAALAPNGMAPPTHPPAPESSRSIVVRIVRRRWKIDRVVLLAGAEFEDFPQQPRRHRRNRIDVDHGVVRRANHLISDANQALVAAAAEEQAEKGNLGGNVVEPIHRDECAPHPHLIARIIDAALDGRADRRSLHHAIPDRELSVLPGQFGA